MLEVLSEFQVTVPELGTIVAEEPPIVVLTSNRTRELNDALKRRCLYHWVGYPDPAMELEILRARLPGMEQQLAHQVVSFVQRLRREELDKVPGVAESLDWMRALMALEVEELTPGVDKAHTRHAAQEPRRHRARTRCAPRPPARGIAGIRVLNASSLTGRIVELADVLRRAGVPVAAVSCCSR